MFLTFKALPKRPHRHVVLCLLSQLLFIGFFCINHQHNPRNLTTQYLAVSQGRQFDLQPPSDPRKRPKKSGVRGVPQRPECCSSAPVRSEAPNPAGQAGSPPRRGRTPTAALPPRPVTAEKPFAERTGRRGPALPPAAASPAACRGSSAASRPSRTRRRSPAGAGGGTGHSLVPGQGRRQQAREAQRRLGLRRREARLVSTKFPGGEESRNLRERRRQRSRPGVSRLGPPRRAAPRSPPLPRAGRGRPHPQRRCSRPVAGHCPLSAAPAALRLCRPEAGGAAGAAPAPLPGGSPLGTSSRDRRGYRGPVGNGPPLL